MTTETLELPPETVKSIHKDNVMHRIACGQTQRSIAKDFNTTQTAVSTIKKNNEKRIALLKQQLIQENTDNIQESIKTDIENNNNLSYEFKNSENITSEKVAYKNSVQKNLIKPLLESVGIYPSNTIVYGNTNIQNNTVVTPSYQSFLDYQATQHPDKDDNSGELIDIDVDNGDNKQ